MVQDASAAVILGVFLRAVLDLPVLVAVTVQEATVNFPAIGISIDDLNSGIQHMYVKAINPYRGTP